MSPVNLEHSVGFVETRKVAIPLPPEGFRLEGGGALPELEIAYETYGTLAPAKDNVVFVCHALSGDAHVAGYHTPTDKYPGWWDDMIGPGKGIDTNRYYVVCANILGGCKGTTGPSSINPATKHEYGADFPEICIGDIVRVHRLLLECLGIPKLLAVVGGSFGGMQVLEWGIRFPDTVGRCICIASAASLSAQALAFDIVGREVITKDPAWAEGNYYGAGRGPEDGLAAARMIGHITYLSPEIMTSKFGRRKKELASLERFQTRFEVESYLQYQGEKFVERFDPNSYLHITHAMDSYDLAEAHGGLTNAFHNVRARFLIIALSSDWLFPPEQSLELATALVRSGKRVSYCLLRAPYGHDAFLVDIAHLANLVTTFLVSPDAPSAQNVTTPVRHPSEHEMILSLMQPRARVLDLGCGNGDLLAMLAANRQSSVFGVEIDLVRTIAAIAKGLDVYQGDLDEGLDMFPDQFYDYVILSQTLQEVRKPREVLRQMLRVAREGIVSFPNFANWTNRISLALKGRMPKTKSLPFEWYDTPNIHLATLRDFVDLCRQEKIRVAQVIPCADSGLSRLLIGIGLPNLGAERVLVKIGRS
jgi:homoserine O-acetyltransferase/O-succinyltransferase